jgi:hypothetical protein
MQYTDNIDKTIAFVKEQLAGAEEAMTGFILSVFIKR